MLINPHAGSQRMHEQLTGNHGGESGKIRDAEEMRVIYSVSFVTSRCQ